MNFYNEDCNNLLRRLYHEISSLNGVHCLLVYDPYDASIDWEALKPFINIWGEVIINHMVSDSVRASRTAKSPEAVSKYERTYQAEKSVFMAWGSNRETYEKRIEAIITSLRTRNDMNYFIASFPFFNSRNALVYNLLHCTAHIKGFKLFKKKAWQVFGGKSSNKDTHGAEFQIAINFDDDDVHEPADEDCYHVKDIIDYIHMKFRGLKDIPLNEIWKLLENHPVFPSEGFRKEIKKGLEQIYGDKLSAGKISFTGRGRV